MTPFMSISPTSAALSGLDTATKISTAVARKTLDAQKQQGDAVVALLQSAVENARDQRAARESGVGFRLDSAA